MIISTNVTIVKEPTKCKLEIDGISIEQIMEINYLCMTLSDYGDIEGENQIQHQLRRTTEQYNL